MSAATKQAHSRTDARVETFVPPPGERTRRLVETLVERRHIERLTQRSVPMTTAGLLPARNMVSGVDVQRAAAVRATASRPSAPREERHATPPGVPRTDAPLHAFALPVTRSLARQAAAPAADAVDVRAASASRPSVAPAAVHHPAAPQPFDIARLSEDVYRHIQRKVRIDRERRGL